MPWAFALLCKQPLLDLWVGSKFQVASHHLWKEDAKTRELQFDGIFLSRWCLLFDWYFPKLWLYLVDFSVLEAHYRHTMRNFWNFSRLSPDLRWLKAELSSPLVAKADCQPSCSVTPRFYDNRLLQSLRKKAKCQVTGHFSTDSWLVGCPPLRVSSCSLARLRTILDYASWGNDLGLDCTSCWKSQRFVHLDSFCYKLPNGHYHLFARLALRSRIQLIEQTRLGTISAELISKLARSSSFLCYNKPIVTSFCKVCTDAPRRLPSPSRNLPGTKLVNSWLYEFRDPNPT